MPDAHPLAEIVGIATEARGLSADLSGARVHFGRLSSALAEAADRLGADIDVEQLDQSTREFRESVSKITMALEILAERWLTAAAVADELAARHTSTLN